MYAVALFYLLILLKWIVSFSVETCMSEALQAQKQRHGCRNLSPR